MKYQSSVSDCLVEILVRCGFGLISLRADMAARARMATVQCDVKQIMQAERVWDLNSCARRCRHLDDYPALS